MEGPRTFRACDPKEEDVLSRTVEWVFTVASGTKKVQMWSWWGGMSALHFAPPITHPLCGI